MFLFYLVGCTRILYDPHVGKELINGLQKLSENPPGNPGGLRGKMSADTTRVVRDHSADLVGETSSV